MRNLGPAFMDRAYCPGTDFMRRLSQYCGYCDTLSAGLNVIISELDGGFHMNKPLFVGITILVLATAGSARAADVLVGAAPVAGPPPVFYNWTGLYLGGNVGGHFGNDDISTSSLAAIDTISSTSLKPQGALAGLQVGYNWQIGNVLLGIELDGNWMDGTASRTLTNFAAPLNRGDVLATDVNPVFLTTLRPRLGVIFDRWLLYVTGGVAFTTIKTTDSFTIQGRPAFTTSNSATRTGETIGGGLEYAFLDSWTFKAEYLYTSFGSYDTDIENNILVHHKYSDNIARIGLNYRFFGPVYWKY
jgi:outer membrane immunogenic protein